MKPGDECVAVNHDLADQLVAPLVQRENPQSDERNGKEHPAKSAGSSCYRLQLSTSTEPLVCRFTFRFPFVESQR
jgi:hypothetical protein